jgi:hypothetical protein
MIQKDIWELYRIHKDIWELYRIQKDIWELYRIQRIFRTVTYVTSQSFLDIACSQVLPN